MKGGEAMTALEQTDMLSKVGASRHQWASGVRCARILETSM